MKRIIVLTLVSGVLLTACTSRQQSPRYAAPFPRDLDDNLPTVDVQPTASAPAPTPAPPSRRDAAYGIPEPGKPGFIRSPHNPDKGLIDVRGLAPATEIHDSYTPGKIILVP